MNSIKGAIIYLPGLRSLFKQVYSQPPDTYTVLPRYLCQDSLDNSRSPKTMSILPNWCLFFLLSSQKGVALMDSKELSELDVLPEFQARGCHLKNCIYLVAVLKRVAASFLSGLAHSITRWNL